MSRLHEIVENHEQLDQLSAVLKHHGVNAQFVTSSLIEALAQGQDQDEKDKETDKETKASNDTLVSDLKQLFSTY